jgi:hypothetical protein
MPTQYRAIPPPKYYG